MRASWAVLAAAIVACAPTSPVEPDGAVTDEACATDAQTRCTAGALQECRDGVWTEVERCDVGLSCDPALGCVVCRPGDGNACVGDDIHRCNRDGSIGELVGTCPLETCRNGSCGGDDCAGGTELIYVVDQSYRLLSFDPADDAHAFALIGELDCPAGPSWPAWGGVGPATPFSMSVDREGRAWVLYTSGEIFWVDIADASCEPSNFDAGQQGFELFGMGFVADASGSADETLFVAGGDADQSTVDVDLGRIDPSTAALLAVGPVDAGEFGPELTGTGDAELFGYFPATIAQSRIAAIDETTGALGRTWELGALGSQVRAWAFAHWGGRFYVFVTTEDGVSGRTSKVQRLDPATGDVVDVVPESPYVVVGAGVSTCAPVVIE